MSNPITSLNIAPDTEQFEAYGRVGLGLPVPYFTPVKLNQVIAFDLFPNGTPGNNSTFRGPAWFDLCSTDINTDGTNFECLRMTKLVNGPAIIGASAGGTGTIQPLQLQQEKGATIVGANSTPETFSGTIPTVQITSNDGDPTAAIASIFRWSTAAATAGQFILARSRGATLLSRTVVQGGDRLGQIGFYGDDGTNIIVGASIRAEVVGSPTTTNMPSRIVLGTRPASGGVTDALFINSDKTVQLATFTVAGLPAAGTAGKKAFVTDANATTFATIVASGGTNKVPVYDDGTNWRIG